MNQGRLLLWAMGTTTKRGFRPLLEPAMTAESFRLTACHCTTQQMVNDVL